MQIVFRCHIKPGKQSELNKFVLAKEKENIENAPGWKYLGSYFTSFGFGEYDFEWRFEIENYASIDAWRDAPDAAWKRFSDSFYSEFVDTSRPMQTAILREASEPSSIG
jgi:antibiotic biosynthesis monooxygenase (ABM) superfamily enzyme